MFCVGVVLLYNRNCLSTNTPAITAIAIRIRVAITGLMAFISYTPLRIGVYPYKYIVLWRDF
jgi:hypothetical protein